MRNFRELVEKNRTCRRFYENERISMGQLESLVELARLSPSGANMQPLKFMLFCDSAENSLIFPCLAWAGYLKDWPGPEQGERPSAYIVILGDTEIKGDFGCDHGIAAQSIMLGATEAGLAGCMIGSIQREKLREVLKIPDRYKILLVLALGKPRETVVVESAGPDGDIKYWRDQDGVHHVPKRTIDELVLRC